MRPPIDRLPADLDAERFILASIIQNPVSYPDVANRVGLDDFSLERNRRIFVRMGDLYIHNLPIDTNTLVKELQQHEELGFDGIGYVCGLGTGMPRLLDVDGYIRILREKRALRQAVSLRSSGRKH